MKKNSTRALFAVAVLSALCTATSASAGVIIDTYDPADTTLTFGGTPSTLSFVFDITNDGFNSGDIINSATVDIHLMDSTGSEKYTFMIGDSQTFSKNVPGGGGGSTETITLDAVSLADLQADGQIGITITSTKGSFIFADSTLTAQVDSPGIGPEVVAAAPEPATLALFGLGLLGFAASRRKSARKNSL